MNHDFSLTLAGGAIAGFGMLLLLARLPNSNWQKATLRAAIVWSRTTNAQAVPLLVAVFATAALALSATGHGPAAWAAIDPTAAGAPIEERTAARTADDTTDEALAVLRSYVGGLDEEAQPAQSPRDATSPNLPDVETMITRLASRLANEPGDIDGWRTLGWSYAHTDHHAEAVKAYETALALDPTNAELKDALETARREATSRTAGSENATTSAN